MSFIDLVTSNLFPCCFNLAIPVKDKRVYSLLDKKKKALQISENNNHAFPKIFLSQVKHSFPNMTLSLFLVLFYITTLLLLAKSHHGTTYFTLRMNI